MPEYTDEWFVARAKELYQEGGEIEIEYNAVVSRSNDGGAYVQAWVWVQIPEKKEG